DRLLRRRRPTIHRTNARFAIFRLKRTNPPRYGFSEHSLHVRSSTVITDPARTRRRLVAGYLLVQPDFGVRCLDAGRSLAGLTLSTGCSQDVHSPTPPPAANPQLIHRP